MTEEIKPEVKPPEVAPAPQLADQKKVECPSCHAIIDSEDTAHFSWHTDTEARIKALEEKGSAPATTNSPVPTDAAPAPVAPKKNPLATIWDD